MTLDTKRRARACSVSVRTCIACGAKKPIGGLLRFAVDQDAGLFVDWSRRRPGRGAHVCRTTECVERAVSRRLFNRALRRQVTYPLVTELVAEVRGRLSFAMGEMGSAEGLVR